MQHTVNQLLQQWAKEPDLGVKSFASSILLTSQSICLPYQGMVKIPWYLEMDRPYPTSLTFTPTSLDVAESSIIALIIFSVFVTTNTALLHTLQIK